MIRKCQLLFCDNEHGTGDVTFPDISIMTTEEIQQQLILPRPVSSLRADAKKEGWSRHNGADYCPSCTESMKEAL